MSFGPEELHRLLDEATGPAKAAKAGS